MSMKKQLAFFIILVIFIILTTSSCSQFHNESTSVNSSSDEKICNLNTLDFINEFTQKTGVDLTLVSSTPVDDFARCVYAPSQNPVSFRIGVDEKNISKELISADITFESDLSFDLLSAFITTLDVKVKSNTDAEDIFSQLISDQTYSKSGSTSSLLIHDLLYSYDIIGNSKRIGIYFG